jgi:transcriptional regulator with XRE-family HTH domain
MEQIKGFGKRINTLRTTQNLTAKDLGMAVGITNVAILKYEKRTVGHLGQTFHQHNSGFSRTTKPYSPA